MSDPTSGDNPGPSRRGLLTGLAAGMVGAAAGAGVTAAAWPKGSATSAPSASATAVATDSPPSASGRYQAGIRYPITPQRFGYLLVLDIPTTAIGWLADVGTRILDIADGRDIAGILPDGPGDLTMSVGLGPRLIAAVDPKLPGAEAMPAFAGDDEIDTKLLGGDVALSAYSSDPTVLAAVLDDLATRVPGATVAWQQSMFRGQGEGTKARNPLGFEDGVVVPHGEDEFDENVWITDGALASGTVCCIRRLRLDIRRFRAESIPAREAVIGRKLSNGAPLSGGGPNGQVDLNAKTPEGEFVTPAGSHARGAHPSFTGSALMLRRSYSFDNSPDDQGLVFISFQHDLRTFVVTQQRLDDVDELMKYSTPTAGGTFLMLPGFTRAKPLGATLA